jgi:UDP-4-amino-4,6-dideoxy-N-acetyl-beta-L-altrosamine transaminase
MSQPAASFLPYGRQSIDDADVAAVVSVLRGDWLTTGPAVEQFEQAFAEAVGARYAVACSSGTAGLHLAAMALGLGEGDRAIVPSMTFLATANAVRYVGGEVVFADIDGETGLLDEHGLGAALDRATSESVKAVFPVHMNGQCVDLEMVADKARARGLAVVEDAAHAIGSSYAVNGEQITVGACRHSDMTVFSLHAVKTIAMGEGGVVTTNDDGLRDGLRRFRNHGMTRNMRDFENTELAFDLSGEANPWYYEMSEPGFNYRASDLHCALGLSQLGKLGQFVKRRASLAARYDEGLQPLAPLVRPITRVEGCRPAWHLYVVLIDFEAAGTDRAGVMRRLKEAGIGTQVHYIPVHHQPYYRQRYGKTSLPGVDAYYARCLSLPLFPTIGNEDVDRVVDMVRGIIEGGR